MTPNAGWESSPPMGLHPVNMPNAVPSLNYARRPRWCKRKSIRIVCVTVSVLVLIAAALFAGPRLSQRITLFELQRRCLRSQHPPEFVVYSVDRTFTAVRASNRIVGSTDPAWTQLYAALSPPGAVRSADVLVHSRRTPRGACALIALSQPSYSSGDWIEFNATVVELGNALVLPRIVSNDVKDVPVPGMVQTKRVYAGQPDPKDDSHFTIVVLIDGRQTLVDGWLEDDDSIKLEPRQN